MSLVFKLHLTREPEDKQSLRRIVPVHLTHSRGYVAKVEPGCGEVISEAQRRIILEKFFWLQGYNDIFHVRFAFVIGKKPKASYTLVRRPFSRDHGHARLLG